MKYSGYDILLGGLFIALAIVFPIIFHAVGLGNAFLPMFYPIILAGFLISFPVSTVVGIISPLLSGLLTGMPPFFPPVAFIMMIEGFVLTAVPSILSKRFNLSVRIALIVTILVDRLVLLCLVVFVSHLLQLPEDILGVVSVVRGAPGIFVILLVLPVLVRNLKKRIHLMAVME